jgi:branched-chain amino acid transport system ATP-binding protein
MSRLLNLIWEKEGQLLLILSLKNITAGYAKAVVLEDMNLDINEGECHAVLGPNGSGKSTLLKVITGSVFPAKGSIFFLGNEITGRKTFEIARMGVSLSPENRRLFPDLSVKENLEIAMVYESTKSKKNSMEFVFEIFPRLKERITQKAGTMSGGEQQMLAIGRAIMLNPKVLLLDEPSMGLAHVIKEQIFEGINKIRSTGKTILIV